MTAALKFKNTKPSQFFVSPQQRADVLHRHQLTERLVDEKERLLITGMSRSTWYRLEQENRVPRARKPDNKRRYLLSELLFFVENG